MHINRYFEILYKFERTITKYDLDNINRLLEHIGNPHKKLKFIHIAGTNGKGGTASILASILIEHGLKTGLYTSPHILKFNERIQINGNFIPDKYIKRFIDDNLSYIKKTGLSFFEVTTALAFKYFADKKIDIGVIEVGLGGRLDTTNVIDPELSIITQIGIDHTQYLGKTLNSIAREKIGIVKKSKDVIISDTNKSLHKLFSTSIKDSKVYFLDEHIATQEIRDILNEERFSFRFKDNKKKFPKTEFILPLSGKHQIRNAGTAILASKIFLDSINRKINISKTKKALLNVKKNTFYHCRFEGMDTNKGKYIFDISHNPDAIRVTLNNARHFPIDVIVFGIMKDKDYKTALKHFSEVNIPLIVTQPAYFRARNPETLYRYYRNNFAKSKGIIIKEKNLNSALKRADKMKNKGYILVLGSFFLVSEAIRLLKVQKYLV